MSEIVYERPNLADTTHSGGELINSNRFAFLLLLGVDVMLFAGLIGGYIVLRANALTWPPPGSPAGNTALMAWTCPAILIAWLALSYSARAEQKMNAPARKQFLLLSIVGVAVFLILSALELTRMFQEGLRIMTIFGGIYLIDVGAFLIHLLIGLVVVVGAVTSKRRSPNLLGNLTNYFFVLSVVWLTIFTLIYV